MRSAALPNFVEEQGRLLWIDGFLKPGQCEEILSELEFAHWWPSTVARYATKDRVEIARSSARVSESTDGEWFSAPLTRMIRSIEKRLSLIVPGVPARCERWQATRYARGGKFDFHFDCGHWAKEPAGERARTILIYLDSPAAGGATCFRELDLEVRPVAGRLVVWRNLRANGKCDPDMLHAGAPLRKGTKTVLVTWVRQRRVRRGV